MYTGNCEAVVLKVGIEDLQLMVGDFRSFVVLKSVVDRLKAKIDDLRAKIDDLRQTRDD